LGSRSETVETARDIEFARECLKRAEPHHRKYWEHFIAVNEARLALLIGVAGDTPRPSPERTAILDVAILGDVRRASEKLGIGDLVKNLSDTELDDGLLALRALNARWYEALRLRVGGVAYRKMGEDLKVSARRARQMINQAVGALREILPKGCAEHAA
jgi:hypothetical protein